MRLTTPTVLLVSLLAATSALAAQDNACWNRNLQRMDYYTDPPQGGDLNFFTAQAQSGVIVLLYPTKASMKQFPLSLYEIRHDLGGTTPTGCNNTFLNNLQYALPTAGTSYTSLDGTYSSSKTYPDIETAFASNAQPAADGIATTGTNSYYRYTNWPTGGTGGTAESALTACTTAAGTLNVLQIADCQSCVASKGYWLNPLVNDKNTTTSAGVFAGKWLRFYPNKAAILRLAYKRMVAGPLLGTLREAVMTSGGSGGNGTDGVGGYIIQKLLPQSCNGQGAANGNGILKQKLDVVAGLTYTSTKLPLAEMMFNDGYYQSGNSSAWCCSSSGYFNNSALINSNPGSDNKGGPCPGCQQNFFVIFSDGRGDTANPYCTPDTQGNLPGPCQAAAQCSTLGMGEGDGDNFLSPSITNGAGSRITGAGVRQLAPGTCDMEFADDVAGWLATNDMDPSHPGSNILSYVVGIGSNTYGAMNTLQAVADRGNGGYLAATDFKGFENALTRTLQEIIQRTTSFSVAAITTVQTRGTTYAFIPRFQPEQGNVWGGKLFRLSLFNEFSAGCTDADTKPILPATKLNADQLSRNPNGNTSCTDVYLRDANGAFVGDDTDGNIVKLDTTKPYPWSPMARTGAAPGTPQYATPLWEASSLLTQRVEALNGGTSTDERTIYTVYDSNNDGTYDTRISFDTTSANLATITPLLKLGGANSTFCNELSAKTNHKYNAESECAADLIKYIRGQDVLLQNPLNRTVPPPNPMKARPNILGDIFHSSPILLTPPAATFLCDLGVVTQCSDALYRSKLSPGGAAGYATYATNNQHRTQVLLVGANDGMLHAFNAGNDKTGDDPSTPTVEGSNNHYFDTGTGREMWSFIPPDLLPKLRLYIIGTRHEMFVDGTPMVKDVWVDGSGATSADNVKQTDEYHTVAIVGEREGGRGYLALDVTSPADPRFLWQWPPPGSTDALNVGQSWNDFAPSPPPIGPIAIEATNGPLTVNGIKAKEKWVVALGGGYDSNLIRGAGLYVLDVWTGQQIYRAARTDVSAAGTDPRKNMFPIVAVPTFLDSNGDGLFDSLIAGDVMGQVWVAGLQNPGKDTNNDGLMDNWFAARGFVEFKGQALYKRSPFFQMASAAVLNSAGDVRVYIGSGTRDQIKDSTGGTCQLSDLIGCMRNNCSVNVKQTTYQSGTHYLNAQIAYTASGTGFSTYTYSNDATAVGNACTDTANVTITTDITCGGTAQPTITNSIACDWSANECVGSGEPESAPISYTPAVTMENARFYSFHLYDSGNRKPFTTLAQAITYDTNALTDSDLLNADATTFVAATDTGNGYYIKYPNLPEKTASQALVLAGCVIVNTLKSAAPPENYCGGSLPSDTAYTYQADAISGAVQCGTGTTSNLTAVRSTSTSAIVPPPMATPVISVNTKTNQSSYSGVSLPPGGTASSINIGGGDIIGPVEWIEVPRSVHNCRHNGTCQ